MKKSDRSAWIAKTIRLNADASLEVGARVVDLDGHAGVVVKIEDATPDYHGTVFVWQSERTGHGADNCEHYTIANSKSLLRRTDGK